MIFGVPMILAVFYFLIFLVGVAFIPLFAYTIGPSLGQRIPETIANVIWKVTMLGVRRGVLEQTETDEYVVRRANADLEPRSYWTRWALAPFAITFEKTREAFAPYVLSEREQESVEARVADGDGVAPADIERGRQSWYINTRTDLGNTWLVPIGRRLEVLRDAADAAMGREAYNETLKEEGGDTSDYSARTELTGLFVFTLLGIGVGWIVLF